MPKPRFIQPDWPAPSNIRAFTSCRSGGFSQSPYDSFNLGQHVGDDVNTVNRNRQLLPNYQNISWLEQVHSNICVDLDNETHTKTAKRQADACFSTSKNRVCAVMTADCLPILLCDTQGTCVAAVHAGWRGLANNVIESAVEKMPADNHNIMAWMGPAISQKYFEVGSEVLNTFADYPQAFVNNELVVEEKFFADLYYIAKQKLLKLGVQSIFGGEYCTYQQQHLFFSHRRATHQANALSNEVVKTGRMVNAIYLL